MQPKFTPSEMMEFLNEVFPQVRGDYAIDHLDGETVTMRLFTADHHLRPGGTVSGPSMFALADITAYVATMAPIGKEALAVTTNISMDFMRKPEAGRDLIAKGTLLKLGRALAVTDVLIYSEGTDKPVARASLTYSIPPSR
ncbi:PaaI family thioesterase [Sedimentitalea todarodis]|uniref:PaaI family thioesterase n=1 Tax=Sedimentitalea todarodis TaxID=1631240 RepID=A0ABU3VAX6_9RHOB|nr:PaaI family thioesterase [Sedimentitalea todarodis]MDU9003333.1 PaaI family thioesterase [Sedimentitalea todarodis]